MINTGCSFLLFLPSYNKVGRQDYPSPILKLAVMNFLTTFLGGEGDAVKKRAEDIIHRKNVASLTEGERQDLETALQRLIDSGGFVDLANFHGEPQNICKDSDGNPDNCCPHGNSQFLPWHRFAPCQFLCLSLCLSFCVSFLFLSVFFLDALASLRPMMEIN